MGLKFRNPKFNILCNPLEFRGQYGYSGTIKGGGIELWLYTSIS